MGSSCYAGLRIRAIARRSKPRAADTSGYLFVGVDDAGRVEDQRWQAASQVARGKRMPDRRTLVEVTVVAQDRAAALRVADRAISDGFTKVLYRGAGDELWDPFPPGLWVLSTEQPTSR